MEESWDYLIVLDACRYDYFEKLWRHYLPAGNLERRKSVGSCTVEWRDRSFDGYYPDVVYVSSNPYINSIKPVASFWGREHFHQVVDVWLTGWQKQEGTVPPDTVSQAALRTRRQYPEKRMIIHYLQPHAPYLGFGSDCEGFPEPDVEQGTVLMGTNREHSKGGLRRRLYRVIYRRIRKSRFWGNHPDWKLAQMLGLPPKSPMDAVRRRYGTEGLRRAYQENLQIVLAEVGRLLRYLKGRIVVTSDHGELLGEGRSFSHEKNSDDPILREIPWWSCFQESALEMPFLKEEMEEPVQEENAIEKRLRDLGYL
jgi:hypothetical protein